MRADFATVHNYMLNLDGIVTCKNILEAAGCSDLLTWRVTASFRSEREAFSLNISAAPPP